MNFPTIAFYVFAAVTVLSALAVITVKNSVHAALSLVLSFFSTACLWILLQAEFLGLVLVLVYVGAVMVLLIVARPHAQGLAVADPAQTAHLSNTAWLSQALFSQYTLPFEIAALILTVAVVAAILLTLRRREGVKSQNPGEQVRVRAADRVRIVKMESSQPAVQSPDVDAPEKAP